MNYRLLIAGLLLLWNPEITIFDLLPDCIGFLLIAKALAPLAPASPSAEEATAGFRKLAWISAIKAAAFLPMMSLYRTEKEVTLLFTAGFAILTAIYLFPAFSNLFAAIHYFSERANTTVRGTGAVRIFCYVAFLLRYFLAMVPESVYLFMDKYESMAQNVPVYPLAAYRTGITVLATTVSFMVGLIFLVVFLRYLSVMKRNRALNEEIYRTVSSVVHSKGQSVLAAVKPAMLLLTLSFLFLIHYVIEGMPLFPPFISPLLILVTVRILKKCITLPKRFTVFPLLASISSLLSYLVTFVFCEKYYDKASVGFILVKEQYRFPVILEGVSAVFFVITVLFCVVPVLNKLIDEHSGAFWEIAYVSHNSATAKEKQAQLFRVKLLPLFALLCAAINTVSFALYYTHPLLQMLSASTGIVLCIFCHLLFSSILQSVKEKYAEEKKS